MKKPPGTCTVRFLKPRAPIVVAEGENLMTALLNAGVPVASSCRGDGVCAKCRVKVTEGLQHLSTETNAEAALRLRLGIPGDERLSCQAQVIGDIKIDTAYW